MYKRQFVWAKFEDRSLWATSQKTKLKLNINNTKKSTYTRFELSHNKERDIPIEMFELENKNDKIVSFLWEPKLVSAPPFQRTEDGSNLWQFANSTKLRG